VRDGRVVETSPREGLWAAQTPQVFRAALLREALARAQADGFRGTDDAQLVERLIHGNIARAQSAGKDRIDHEDRQGDGSDDDGGDAAEAVA
jgi:2-C-methyl-D-erythritol 4-phosphate cytidylyltransferase